jgi:integrase
MHPPPNPFYSLLKSDAEAWGRAKEVALETSRARSLRTSSSTDAGLEVSLVGGLSPASPASTTTLSDLLVRYKTEVTSGKRSVIPEGYMIATIKRTLGRDGEPLGSIPLGSLTPSVLAGYRDTRLTKVSPSSVRRELAIIQHCLEVARKEWGVPMPSGNPMAMVTKPTPARARTRRVTDDDALKIAKGVAELRNGLLANIIHFAIATGMRRGEILSLKWIHINDTTAYLPLTKNGESRTVPLGPDALRVLAQLERTGPSVFPMSANAVRLAWERMKRRVGIKDLRFHDLRHEAISRFFEYGLSVPEVALISGHKDTRMLFRYTHLKPEDVAEKLASVHRAAPSTR